MTCRLTAGTAQSGVEPCDEVSAIAKAFQADAPPAPRLNHAGLLRLKHPSPPHVAAWLPGCPAVRQSLRCTSEWDPGMVAADLPAPLGGGPWLISLAASSCSYSVAISEGVLPSCSRSRAHSQEACTWAGLRHGSASVVSGFGERPEKGSVGQGVEAASLGLRICLGFGIERERSATAGRDVRAAECSRPCICLMPLCQG